MRKLLTIALVGILALAALPAAALAGDHHVARHVWAGIGIGVAAATLGGLFLGAAPVPVAAGPPVVYAPPAVMYAPPQPVLYSPRPIVIYRGWAPPGHWKHHRYWRYEHR